MKTVDILNIAEKYKEIYSMVAIRTQEEPFELGEIQHKSKVWDDGEETEEELEGICATHIESSSLKMHCKEESQFSYYYGEHKAIICGNDYEYGYDEGEVIIKDAIVVEIIS